jgi:hypothetical protein
MTETQSGPQLTSDAPTMLEAQARPGEQEQQDNGMPQLHPVFAKQLEALATGDFDALLQTFHPDIVSLSFRGPLYGREEAHALLRKYEGLEMEFLGIEEYVHCADMIMTRTKMRVEGQEIVAFGAYVIRDGMIWRQFGCDEGGSRDWWGTNGDDANAAQ